MPLGFIVTNLSRPAERVVAFYNKRGTCEQWIKEGKGAIKWTRLSCCSVTSELLRDYDRNENRLVTEQALIATQNGFGWANAHLKHRKLPQLYCISSTPTGAQLIDILRRSMKRQKFIADAPYGLGLLMAMQEQFPCDKRH